MLPQQRLPPSNTHSSKMNYSSDDTSLEGKEAEAFVLESSTDSEDELEARKNAESPTKITSRAVEARSSALSEANRAALKMLDAMEECCADADVSNLMVPCVQLQYDSEDIYEQMNESNFEALLGKIKQHHEDSCYYYS